MSDADAPTAVARRFLAGLEAMDVDAALACFAPEGVQEMPFAPPGFPSRLDGMDDLRRQYGGLPAAYASMRFDPLVLAQAFSGERMSSTFGVEEG